MWGHCRSHQKPQHILGAHDEQFSLITGAPSGIWNEAQEDKRRSWKTSPVVNNKTDFSDRPHLPLAAQGGNGARMTTPACRTRYLHRHPSLALQLSLLLQKRSVVQGAVWKCLQVSLEVGAEEGQNTDVSNGYPRKCMLLEGLPSVSKLEHFRCFSLVISRL